MSQSGLDEVRQRYVDLFGAVPPGIERRLTLGERADRIDAVIAIEELRNALIHHNALDPKVQQLVHFGQLLAMLRLGPAELHAKAALKAGATLEELMGVAETSLITSGMPSYAAGIDIIHTLLNEYGS